MAVAKSATSDKDKIEFENIARNKAAFMLLPRYPDYSGGGRWQRSRCNYFFRDNRRTDQGKHFSNLRLIERRRPRSSGRARKYVQLWIW
ncbi:hypothetical protein ACVJGD_004458 [Bradyrhizobium sp. USDA 10063]